MGLAEATVLLSELLVLLRVRLAFLVPRGFLAATVVAVRLRLVLALGAEAGGAIGLALLVAAVEPPLATSSSSLGLLLTAVVVDAEVVVLDMLPGAASLDGRAIALRGVGMLLIFCRFQVSTSYNSQLFYFLIEPRFTHYSSSAQRSQFSKTKEQRCDWKDF